MKKPSIYHISEHNFAYAVSKNELNVRLRTAKGDVDKVYIYYKNLYDHTDFYFKKQMDTILCDELSVLYESTIKVIERHFKYYFELHSGDSKVYYTADGFLESIHEHNCFYFPVINTDEIIDLPKWAEGAMIYQILVDRFFDADSSNNPKNTKCQTTLPDNNTYYGGDFQGVIEKMDYIKSLGTDILYLSPVFVSPTYHKYDTKDYYSIEEIYGGKSGLKKLVDYAHKSGVRIMLDGVFNHCSDENELFKDVIKYGESSKYKDWFIIESFPIDTKVGNYDSFGGLVPSMPRFDTSNPEVIKYLCDVCLYWTKELDIDGWRMDVADEVSHTLWQVLRRRLKAYNKDILFVGEIWNHASKWLQGNEFDTMTNYKFRKWMLDFAKCEIDSKTFWDKISANNMLYKTPLKNYMINLLGSHDTIRYATDIDDEESSLLAMIMTLTMPGIPLVYYGDEYAQEGDVDPDNRRAMQWHRTVDNAFLEQVKETATLRKTSNAIKKGNIVHLNIGARVLGFVREYEREKIIVIANFAESDLELNLDGDFLFEKCNDFKFDAKEFKKLAGQGTLNDNEVVLKSKQFIILGNK